MILVFIAGVILTCLSTIILALVLPVDVSITGRGYMDEDLPPPPEILVPVPAWCRAAAVDAIAAAAGEVDWLRVSGNAASPFVESIAKVPRGMGAHELAERISDACMPRAYYEFSGSAPLEQAFSAIRDQTLEMASGYFVIRWLPGPGPVSFLWMPVPEGASVPLGVPISQEDAERIFGPLD